MPLLRLDKVSLNFGTHVLLDQTDFQISKGQRIGLLGRNGAGKTTLLNTLTLQKSGGTPSGHVRVNGEQRVRGGRSARRLS